MSPSVSWPTAIVLVAGLALVGWVAYLDAAARTAVVGAIGMLLTAALPALVKMRTGPSPLP